MLYQFGFSDNGKKSKLEASYIEIEKAFCKIMEVEKFPFYIEKKLFTTSSYGLNLVRHVNVILRKSTMIYEDDVKDRSSMFKIKPNLSLKLEIC